MKLKLFGNHCLRQKATAVSEYNDSLKILVKIMIEVMYREEGIGLAANQIGYGESVCVMDSSEPDENGIRNKAKVFINPRITEATSASISVEESCLSIPGVFAKTERFSSVTVVYNTEDGLEIEEQLSGIEAIAIQHEVDHLNGKLYVDMLGPVKRNLLLNKSQKYVKAKARGSV